MDSNAPGILTTKEQPSGAGAATESTIHTSSSSSRSGYIGTKSSDGKKKKEGYEIDAALRSLQVDRETVVDGAQVYLSSSSSSFIIIIIIIIIIITTITIIIIITIIVTVITIIITITVIIIITITIIIIIIVVVTIIITGYTKISQTSKITERHEITEGGNR